MHGVILSFLGRCGDFPPPSLGVASHFAVPKSNFLVTLASSPPIFRPKLGQMTPNCYSFGGGKGLLTASLGKSIAKPLGKQLLDHEHRVKWEIPAKQG